MIGAVTQFLANYNAPFFIIGGITVFLLLAWPMGSVPVAPKRRQKRIETYFSHDLGASASRAAMGLKASVETPTGKQHGPEINRARSNSFLIWRTR